MLGEVRARGSKKVLAVGNEPLKAPGCHDRLRAVIRVLAKVEGSTQQPMVGRIEFLGPSEQPTVLADKAAMASGMNVPPVTERGRCIEDRVVHP